MANPATEDPRIAMATVDIDFWVDVVPEFLGSLTAYLKGASSE